VSLPRKLGWSLAATHLVLVLAVATYIARQTRYDGETPRLWFLGVVPDLPVYLLSAALAPHLMSLPHVMWVERVTGQWITGEWEPFLGPLVIFGILGTAWWFFIGWLVGCLWVFIRPRT
jgi:hypothetical protein